MGRAAHTNERTDSLHRFPPPPATAAVVASLPLPVVRRFVPAQLLSVCLLSAPPPSRLWQPFVVAALLLLINSMLRLGLAVPSLVASADVSAAFASPQRVQHPPPSQFKNSARLLSRARILAVCLVLHVPGLGTSPHLPIVCVQRQCPRPRPAPSVLFLCRMDAACLCCCCAPLALRRPPACCPPTVCLCCAASPRITTHPSRAYPRSSALHSVFNGRPSRPPSSLPSPQMHGWDSSCNKHN